MQKQYTVLLITSSLLLLFMLIKAPIVDPHFGPAPQDSNDAASSVDLDTDGYFDFFGCRVTGHYPDNHSETQDINSVGGRMISDPMEKAIDLCYKKVHNFLLTRLNDPTTRRLDSDADVIFQPAKSPNGVSEPSMPVTLLLFGAGIVGFACIHR